MRTNQFRLFLCFFFCLSLMAGCAKPVQVKHIAAQEAINVASSDEAKPILFKKIAVKLPRGTRVGSVSQGFFCEMHLSDLTWQGGTINLPEGGFNEVFRQELEKANYVVLGNPDALFDDPSEWKAELLIGGLIQDMASNICVKPGLLPFQRPRFKGEAYMKVDWQIYSRLGREVVYKTVTEGSNRIDEPTDTAVDDVILNAFAVATQNLLSDKGFHDIVSKSQVVPQKPTLEQVKISKIPPYSSSIQEHIGNVRAAVVTVFAGPGHGSGFFISSEGHLLTNSHVVGEAKFVKIKLATGRELLGEVLRVDRRRDVALIKVEEGNMVCLPIRNEEANVAEEVFCIGSPLDPAFSTTTSKGIVSGYHADHDLKFIQCDVNILPGSSGGPLLDKNGNVMGLAVSGITFSGAPTGLNFFVPIADATERLAIVF